MESLAVIEGKGWKEEAGPVFLKLIMALIFLFALALVGPEKQT